MALPHCSFLSDFHSHFVTLHSASMAFTISRSFLLLLLFIIPPLALSSKCSSPTSASYSDLITAGTLSAIQSLNPHLSHTHPFSPGNTAFSKQSFAVAEACYSRACILDPKQPLALSNRALAVMNQGRNQEALKACPHYKQSHSYSCSCETLPTFQF